MADRHQLNLGDFPKELKDRLERFARQRHISVAGAARMLISQGLNQAEREQTKRPATTL